jgi:hypothetical protein
MVIRRVESIKIHSTQKKLAKTHPSAGPIRKADPKAAPISPIFFARVSAVEISEI